MQQVRKIYQVENLLSPTVDINSRIRKIEVWTEKTKSPVKFEWSEGLLIRKTTRAINDKKKRGAVSLEFHLRLVKACNELYKINLVHGDILQKNIYWNEEQLTLTDWEPCLQQRVNFQNVLMYTPPFIDPRDKIDNKLTHRTDLMCCYFLINRCSLSFFYTSDWIGLSSAALKTESPFDICVASTN